MKDSRRPEKAQYQREYWKSRGDELREKERSRSKRRQLNGKSFEEQEHIREPARVRQYRFKARRAAQHDPQSTNTTPSVPS